MFKKSWDLNHGRQHFKVARVPVEATLHEVFRPLVEMSSLKVSTGGPTDFDGLSGNDNEQRKTIEGNIDWKKNFLTFVYQGLMKWTELKRREGSAASP